MMNSRFQRTNSFYTSMSPSPQLLSSFHETLFFCANAFFLLVINEQCCCVVSLTVSVAFMTPGSQHKHVTYLATRISFVLMNCSALLHQLLYPACDVDPVVELRKPGGLENTEMISSKENSRRHVRNNKTKFLAHSSRVGVACLF